MYLYRNVLTALALAGVTSLLVAPGLALADDQTPVPLTPAELKGITPLAAVVQRNWPRWSAGNDAVTKLGLIAQIAKPEYQGEDAAALVALETYLRQHPSVDLAGAMAIDDAPTLTVYHKNVLKLSRAKRTLFANGQPTFELLQQGPPGDCYFFSATGWMARNRPREVMRAITALEDGRFRVHFANGNEATVTGPTDAELAINDSESTLQDGLWMSVLEKATGTIQARTMRNSAALPDPTVAIDISGVPIASVVSRWTGCEVKKYTLGRQANRQLIREGLIRMHERKSLATALLLHRPPAKLPYDHVYAIVDFDAARNIVTLWNPWGTDFTPNGPSGPANGYERNKGVFNLTLAEFISFYSFLAIEQNWARQTAPEPRKAIGVAELAPGFEPSQALRQRLQAGPAPNAWRRNSSTRTVAACEHIDYCSARGVQSA